MLRPASRSIRSAEQQGMSNALHRCPNCGSDHGVETEAKVMVRLTASGTLAADQPAIGWANVPVLADDGPTMCTRCGHWAQRRAFVEAAVAHALGEALASLRRIRGDAVDAVATASTEAA